MNDALMYFLKVNIAIALFYLFYRLVFYNDTFWSTRRFYLVVSILLSVVYPLISFSGWLEKQEPMQVIIANYVQLNEITVTNAPVNNLNTENVLLIIYGLVSFILLTRTIVQLTSILRWRMKGKKCILQGIEIIAIDATITPFSFFNTIFMNPGLHNEQETRQILTHECTHARQLHSLDVLLSELMTVLFWINPAAWLLKREIRQNLEFLADNSVLKSGIDSKNYQYHLLQLSYQVPENKLINKFNISPLKKRITMMNQQKTKKAGILKYSLIVPLALALVLSSNAETIVNSTNNALSSTKDPEVNIPKENKTQVATVSDKKQTKQQSDNYKIYTVCDKMPQYPGGEKELLNFIGKNIKYPTNALANKIQGKTIARFVVNKTGKVEKAEIVRSLDPECDKEALRVINSMPHFKPAEQNGEKVSVYYTLPIIFKLDEGNVGKTKGADSWKNQLCIIDGVKQPIGFDFHTIKKDKIKLAVDLTNNSPKKTAELIAKYGKNAKNGVILITMKK